MQNHLQQQKIFDQFPHPLFSFDRELSCLYVNSAGAKWIHKKKRELLHNSASDILPDLRILKNLRKVIRSKKAITFEAYSQKHGNWYEVTVFPTDLGISLYCHDISNMKQTEAAFETDRKHLSAILNSTTEGIFGIDNRSRCTFVNDTLLKFIGYTREECIGKNMHYLIHHKKPDGSPYPLKECTNHIAFQKKTASPLTEQVLWHKSGTALPILSTLAPILEKGRVMGAVVTVIDNRRLKEAEEHLRLTEERFRLALKNTNITVFNQDKNLRYTWIYNPHPPLTIEDFLQKTDTQVFEKETAKRLTALKKEVIETGRGAHAELDLKLGEIVETFDMRIEPLKDRSGKVIGIIGAGAEITQRKQLERRKNEFISIASHELKTPITTVRAFAQILKKRLETSKQPSLVYFTDNIIKQVDKLTNLINDLLDVSKIEEGKLALVLKKVDIDELVKKIVVDFQYTTDTHQIVKTGQVNKEILIDEDRIGQVLINLLTNAIKYSPEGSKIIVHTASTTKEVIISVQDFGIGIPKHEQQAIFERFYRTEEKQTKGISGFGLGLYISQVIVKRHGGRIWVESTLGRGSTFFLTIPLRKKRQKENVKGVD